MADVYFYIKKDELNDSLKYGIKLSKNYNGQTVINNINKKYIQGLLNPKDDLEKFNSTEFCCIRATISNDYLFVCDKNLLNSDYFSENIISIADYKFGYYRTPIILIVCSLLPEQLNTINKIIDVPVLYNSSQELYLENAIESLKLDINSCNEIILNSLLENLEKKGILYKVYLDNNTFLYKDSNGKIYTSKTNI